MNSSTEQRKLAAIMFTDMVGYSSLAQRSEALALELLEEHRNLLRPLFPKYNGREVETAGDAFLVEFASALEATRCAVEIQRTLTDRNAGQPAERHIRLRIGIHVGDVVHKDGKVMGDAVNIAARIEPLAPAGGICLSDTVYAQVRNKLEVGLTKLDSPKLKNIEVPMDVYRVVLPWEKAQTNAERGVRNAESKPSLVTSAATKRALIAALVVLAVGLGWWLLHQPGQATKQIANLQTNAPPAAAVVAVTKAPDTKSIAVLPFANLSEEKENAFFTDGIHEDILTTLMLVRDLHVVSRTSVAQYRATTKTMRQIAQELGVAYVLEGSVRRAGNKVRVTGQLIRADSDDHVWAKSYDRDLTDIFAIQSELAKEIVGALQAVLSPQEKSRIEHRPTTNLAAYDLYLKGRAGLKAITPDVTRAQSEQALSDAVKLDPNFAAAWGFLALAHVRARWSEGDTSAERLAKTKTALETAVRLAPDDPVVVEMQGSYYYYGYRDYARATEHYQRLLLIQPNSADAYAQLGFIQRRQGKWAEALANMRHALELEPRHMAALVTCGETLVATRHYDEAIAQYRRVAEVSGDVFLFGGFPFHRTWIPFLAHGSTREGDERIANLKPASEDDPKALYERRAWARTRGDWAAAVKINQKHPYLDPYDDPHSRQDFAMVWDLVGANDLPAARVRAQKLIPEFKARLEQQPGTKILWSNLALLHALIGDKEEALRCARKAVELVPESADRLAGPALSMVLGQVLAWTGDKDAALAELARLLRTVYGANVYTARIDPGWLPLRGDPRFEALLNDPKNNAPLP